VDFMMMSPIEKRYEFVLLFDVENGNPNGDPDAGNMPRIDAETNCGIVTDVCLKRKVRNYVDLVKAEEAGYDIYVREAKVLNEQNKRAYDYYGIDPKDKKAARENADKLKAFMCQNFFDVRTFGAVMTTEVNCGQVRGPVQFNFARSIDPIVPQEISITRMAVTNERDIDKERTMGRKHIVPYGLYRAEGYISAPLAQQTGYSSDDLELLLQALENMFEHDRSAARGKMATRKLFVFEHSTALGNAHAHELFDAIKIRRANLERPARSFSDYIVEVDNACIPSEVTLIERM
jgi:CRISPR-associated protein Csd2